MAAANIYPASDEEELEMAARYFPQVVAYYAEAANRGNAMLLFID